MGLVNNISMSLSKHASGLNGGQTKEEIALKHRRTRARGGSKFDTLLSQRLNLLHPNLGRRFCWNFTAPANQDFTVSIHSLNKKFQLSRQVPRLNSSL